MLVKEELHLVEIRKRRLEEWDKRIEREREREPYVITEKQEKKKKTASSAEVPMSCQVILFLARQKC